MQMQLPVGNWARDSHHFFQSFKGEIFFARPGIGDGEIPQYLRASYRILCHRKELDRTPAVLHSIVPVTQPGLAHAKHAERLCVLRLFIHEFCHLRACRSKRCFGSRGVASRTRGDAFAKIFGHPDIDGNGPFRRY